MQPVIQLLQNEYMRLALATGLICLAAIAAWMLLRHAKLWYWKTETVLDALDTISSRLENVEGKLAVAEQDTFTISENIYAIGMLSEGGKTGQENIREDIQSSHDVQLQINTGIAAVREEIVEVHEEIAGVHELLADSLFSGQEAEAPQTPRGSLYGERSYTLDGEPCRSHAYNTDIFDEDDGSNAIEYFWQGDPEEDFPEEDEDEIRKKIRL